MRWIPIALVLGALAVTAGCNGDQSTDTSSSATPGATASSGSGPTKVDPADYKSGEEGLKYAVLKPGDGKEAKEGNTVKVHYTGWLESTGAKFDSSVDRGEPFEFPLGGGQVIKGWDMGVEGMKVGEKRQLVIPSPLGYGETGAGADIPPHSTLVFDVELLDVADAAADPHAGHNHGPGDGHNH
ncbi:MAG: FKBP-type peptidyl-prolyl cis-trans isomerase [Actinomycetota bacterium]